MSLNFHAKRNKIHYIQHPKARFSLKSAAQHQPEIFKSRNNSLMRAHKYKLNRLQNTGFTCFINKNILFQRKTAQTPIIQRLKPKILPNNLSNFTNNTHNKLTLDLTTKNWCLYNSKTEEYVGFRQNYKREVASLTKIMTTLLSIEFIIGFKISLDCLVRVTQTAVSLSGTSAQLKKNYWISLQDLLYGIMLPSGNDAAQTIAQYLGFLMFQFTEQNKPDEYFSSLEKIDLTNTNTNSYVKEFVACMNEKISFMELYNTRFSNPHGLQNALNTSSALDMIKISRQASKNQLFKQIMNTIYWKYTLYQSSQYKKRVCKKWWNTNKLLEKDWEGIKTGFTTAAGGCLASLKEGIYIVVLNSSNSESRFTDTQKIYNWHKNSLNIAKLTQSLSTKTKIMDSKPNSPDLIENLETDASI